MFIEGALKRHGLIQLDLPPFIGHRLNVDFGSRQSWESAVADIPNVVLVPSVAACSVRVCRLRTAVGGSIIQVGGPTGGGVTVDPGLRGWIRVPCWLHVVRSVDVH